MKWHPRASFLDSVYSQLVPVILSCYLEDSQFIFCFSVPFLPFPSAGKLGAATVTWLPSSTFLVMGLAGRAWPQLLPELSSHTKMCWGTTWPADTVPPVRIYSVAYRKGWSLFPACAAEDPGPFARALKYCHALLFIPWNIRFYPFLKPQRRSWKGRPLNLSKFDCRVPSDPCANFYQSRKH